MSEVFDLVKSAKEGGFGVPSSLGVALNLKHRAVNNAIQSITLFSVSKNATYSWYINGNSSSYSGFSRKDDTYKKSIFC